MKTLFNKISIVSFLFATVIFSSCEKNVEIDIPDPETKYVVEGYIENDAPPYVILTKSIPFFAPTTIEDVENSFEHDATIKVSDGVDTVTLTEYRSDNLPQNLKDLLIDSLGQDIPTGDDEINFAFYTDFTFFGEIGKKYYLWIETQDGTVLTSETTIPQITPLDSLWFLPHPVEAKADSLVYLNGRFSDPAGEDNYARYFTRRNSEPYYPPFFASVVDDKSFAILNGQTFDFAFETGIERNSFDPETYGYFRRGDTISVRWSAIDKPHYDFWLTQESDRNNSGSPFAPPTVIKTNINGGLGIWGGYGTQYSTIIAPTN